MIIPMIISGYSCGKLCQLKLNNMNSHINYYAKFSINFSTRIHIHSVIFLINSIGGGIAPVIMHVCVENIPSPFSRSQKMSQL